MEDFSINFLYGNTDKNKTNNSHHKTLIDNVFYTKVKRNIISKKYSNSTQILPVPGQYRFCNILQFWPKGIYLPKTWKALTGIHCFNLPLETWIYHFNSFLASLAKVKTVLSKKNIKKEILQKLNLGLSQHYLTP